MNSYLILPSGISLVRNGDVHFPFRADSDFLAQTHMDIEGAILIREIDKEIPFEMLFFDEPTHKKRLWESIKWYRDTIKEAGFMGEIRDFDSIFPFLEEHKNDLFYLPNREANTSIYSTLEKLRSCIGGSNIRDATHLLMERRIYKSEDDISKMRKAISVTKQAFDHVKGILRPGIYEYEIEAEFAYFFRKNNMIEAYPTIVASGPNACTLHYTRHDRKLEEGDFVLIDAGAEYMAYAADITRTFSVGDISSRQTEVFESVIRVKQFAQSLLRPGIRKLEYEKKVRECMNSELKKLGLIEEGLSEEEEDILSRKYYPHSTSHFLGLDVHDVGSREAILSSGMILTCEPGIYIPEEGIGVRLEDDILIVENGCENLSTSLEIN